MGPEMRFESAKPTQRRLRPPFFHFLAFNAKVARFRVAALEERFIDRSLDTGILRPFFTPACLRSLPRFAGLM
jgi:hypothetical protein